MEATNGPLRVRWAAVSDVGRTRSVNQDALLASPPLFLVADGMGGHAAGDVASQIAVSAFAELLDARPLAVRDLVIAARTANERILADVEEMPERAGMGTTVSGFSIGLGPLGAYAAVLNVGDSRTYLVRDGVLDVLTVDHSMVQEMIDAGEIEPHEASSHPYRHVVTRALGVEPELEVDTNAMLLQQGDRLLVCSDGLSSVAPHESIEEALLAMDDATDAANRLIEIALELGAPDNVSVIVLDVVAAPEQPDIDDDGDTIPGTRLTSAS